MAGELVVNGVDLGPYVSASGVRRTEEEIGERTRAFSGAARSAIRARKLALDGRVIAAAQAEAAALRGLLQGDGDSWSWDSSLYSARGRPIYSGSAALSGGAIKHGSAGLSVTDIVRWDVGNPLVSGVYATDFSVFGWRDIGGGTVSHFIYTRNASGTVRRHHINGVVATAGDFFVDSDWIGMGAEGALYFNAPGRSAPAWAATTAKAVGSRIKPASSGFAFRAISITTGITGGVEPTWASVAFRATVVDGGVTWQNIGPATLSVDDFVYVPYMVPAEWASPIYTEHNARAWTAQPRLRVTGTLIDNAPRTMRGILGNGDLTRLGSGFRDSFEFSLEED